MKIGEKLQYLREREGYIRKDFAKELGLSPHSLYNYEYRERDVPASVLYRITNHPQFRHYTMWLMTDDDGNYSEHEPVLGANEFGELLEKLDESQLMQILQFMKFLVADSQASSD